MRKVYSLVLMAVALLIGTNTWAKNVYVPGDAEAVGSRANLQAAIDSVGMFKKVGTVTLTLQNDFSLDGPIWLGTANLNDSTKSIILDLNGHNITMSTGGTTAYMFVISHGELFVRNSDITKDALIKLTGSTATTPNSPNQSSQIFSVYGSYRSSRWNEDGNNHMGADSINTRINGYFSHLEIGEHVKIFGDADVLGAAIVVDQLNHGTSPARTAATTAKSTNKINYFTDLYASNYGYAYGVRVDLYGKIEMTGKAGSYVSSGKTLGYKCYGIKTNGNLECPDNVKNLRTTQMNNTTNQYLYNYGSRKEDHALDTIDVPMIYIHTGSKIETTNASTRSAAVYASGYAKWMIQGTCEGNIGASVSSGEIAVDNGTIKSTAENYTPATGDGGVTGSGSAIVVNSRDGYAGNTSVTISGDSEISAQSGYAIEEKVTTSDDNSKTEEIIITGGNIEGGDKGSIAVTTIDEDTNKPVVVTYSGNISGNVSGGDSENPVTLQDLLPSGEGAVEVHTTVIYDENGENPVTVISPGKGNTGWSAKIATSGKDSIKWTGLTETITSNLTLKELEINKLDSTQSPATPKAQTLTIGENGNPVVVTIGKVILGPKAKIIVNPGSKLIITGSQGIYSTVNENLQLMANANAQATFVIGPDVTTNRQPRATVQFYTDCYKAGTNSWVWQRFAAPLAETTSVTHDQEGNIGTGVKYINDINSAWTSIASWSDLTPFTACAITNNLNSETHATYTFPGKLVGNAVELIKRKPATWNYYGNSFMAPISTLALLNVLSANSMSSVIYYWDTNLAKQGYNFVNLEMLVGEWAGDGIESIPAMGFFVLRNNTAEEGDLNIDYKNSVFRYAQGLAPEYPTPAPMRNASSNANKMRISMQDENGATDVVYLLGSNNYSASFEDGADVEKLMNEGMNIYAQADMNYSMLYTDELVNTMLAVQTGEGINYTLTFSKVNGEPYALRDNQTNRVIAITEGATYTFAAQPNETIEGRFEIVGRQEMPTAVETIENNANTIKAVYTVMGQYVGETTDWNNLPAGVYVVDGVKIVK